MKTSIFNWGLALLGLFISPVLLAYQQHSNVQDFEIDFSIQDHPEEFLPGWSANEVRTSSRVFQAAEEGLDGSRALGIQTIGSFDAEIYIKTSTIGIQNPKISFYAKTNQNGSGNRPALLYFSFSNNNSNSFGHKTQIGEKETFPNENTPYQFFELPLPEAYHEADELIIKMEVVYGDGTGTSARLLMDDFTYPGTGPETSSLQISEATLLTPFTLQFSTSHALDTLRPEQVQLTGTHSLSLEILDKQTFLLHASQVLDQHPLELQLHNITSTGNHTAEQLYLEIANEGIYFPQSFVENPTAYLLRFTDLIDPASSLQTSLYSINGHAPIDLSMLDNGYEILLELGQPLQLEEPVLAEVELIKGMSGKESKNLTLEQTYSDHIHFVEAVDHHRIKIFHKTPLDIEASGQLQFQIQDEDFTLVPKLDPQDHNLLWLEVSPELEENSTYYLQLPSRLDRWKQPIPGSIRAFSLEHTPPAISAVDIMAPDQIMISFTEAIDPVMAVFPGHYKINDAEPVEVNWGNDPWQVILTFPFSLNHQTEYQITVSGISDLAGNTLEDGLFTFTYQDPEALAFKSLVINEVMAAPKAENPLPYAEYVEIFNPSDASISMAGMRLANSSRQSALIPAVQLAPKEFLILTSENDKEDFQQFGQTIGLGSWPRYVNGADEVKLLQKNGTVLDSLQYDASSYGSSSYANGGYSLEVVNPYSPCNASLSLQPSKDRWLGTPGKVNSVFDDTPDLLPPLLLESNVRGSDGLILIFNEVLSPDLSQVIWEVSPELEVSSAVFLPGSLTSILLHFDNELKEKTSYTLTIHHLRDCSGNAITPQENQVHFQIPSLANQGEVILNEVLFNPRSGMPKFVEIYNNSEKYIDLNQWKLANYANEMISNRKLIATSPSILAPFSYRVFTTDPSLIQQEYPKAKVKNLVELSALPSYPITGGTVLLLNPEEDLVERLDYSEKLHHDLLRDTKGVSLERHSPDQPVNDPENWHSAAASEGYASPGYQNSQYFEHEKHHESISIDPLVFNPEGIGPPNFTTIRYHLPNPGHLGTLRIFALNGQLVKQICQNAIWGNAGMYTWNGTDLQGKKVRPGYYILWAEIINLQGEVIHYKKTITIGTTL